MTARRMRLPLALAAATLLVVAASGVSSSAALFTAQKSNPGNSFASTSYFGFFASGYYQGNGADDRAISGIGFKPDVVIVKGDTGQTAAIRTSTMTGDAAKPMTGATALTANVIQSLNADGFTVGTNARVNTSGVSYEWMAFRAQDGLLKVGSYTGNGTTQSVTGLGFSPEYAGVFSAAANAGVQRYSGMTTSFQFDADTGNAQRITALGADGFTVGTQNTVNTNGNTYHWIAFNDSAGIVDINSYAGLGTDDRNITGVGFTPEYLAVRANSTGTARPGVDRPATLPGDSTLLYNGTANLADSVQAFQADGFQVGTDTSVNQAATTYHYMAVHDTATAGGGGCANSGSAAVAPSADAYVNQAQGNTNFGGVANLFVRSQNGNANRRALLRFNLPSIPSGCTMTGSTMRLTSSAASTGRTIDVYRAAAAWTENGVTWNNQPATTGTATSRPSALGLVIWDVNAHVQAMYAGTNNGFIVRDQTENSAAAPEQNYQAREGVVALLDPELRVSWQ